MITEITSKGVTLNYGNDGLVADNPKDVLKILREKGVAVYRGVLNKEECEAMNDGMWHTAEYLTSGLPEPLKRDIPRNIQSSVQFGSQAWRIDSGVRVGTRTVRVGCATKPKNSSGLPRTLWRENTAVGEYGWHQCVAWLDYAKGKTARDVQGEQLAPYGPADFGQQLSLCSVVGDGKQNWRGRCYTEVLCKQSSSPREVRKGISRHSQEGAEFRLVQIQERAFGLVSRERSQGALYHV